MSMGIVRGLITLVLFAAFIALVFFAWSHKRKEEYDHAARLPLEESDAPASSDVRVRLPGSERA